LGLLNIYLYLIYNINYLKTNEYIVLTMTDQLKKLYKISTTDKSMTYYVLSILDAENYIKSTRKRSKKNSKLYDILSTDDYIMKHLFIGETNMEYLKDSCRLLIEMDDNCLNVNKPRSKNQLKIYNKIKCKEYYDKKAIDKMEYHKSIWEQDTFL